MAEKSTVPPVDLESYVPRAITVVRRSEGWPGIFLHDRRGAAGSSGTAAYTSGIRQHVYYHFLKGAKQEVVRGNGKERIEYAPGEGRFTPARNPVQFKWDGAIRVLILGFEPWYFERIAAEIGAPPEFSKSLTHEKIAADHPASTLIRQLANELEPGPGGTFLADSLARAIAVHLLRGFLHLPAPRIAQPAPPAAVLRAVALMRSRLAENVTLEDLAKAAGLSPFHFARQFKTATGHPPHEYHIRLRVDRAQELLRTMGRQWSLAAIASECGFVDQSHFSRHFKRVVGATPGEFLG